MTNEQFTQIKQKIQYGDYNVLQKILNTTSVQSARMRFLRKDEDAIVAMKKIQENREKFIQENQENQELKN